jgi:hypothetical protein
LKEVEKLIGEVSLRSSDLAKKEKDEKEERHCYW